MNTKITLHEIENRGWYRPVAHNLQSFTPLELVQLLQAGGSHKFQLHREHIHENTYRYQLYTGGTLVANFAIPVEKQDVPLYQSIAVCSPHFVLHLLDEIERLSALLRQRAASEV